MHASALPLSLLSLLALLAPSLLAESLYPRSSLVLPIDATSYRSLIEKSNHTTLLEFYAPWCGHCKNLAPALEKTARSLAGLAKVAAVNCDEESNKAFCGQMGIQGFPTLKLVRPGKKPGRPTVEAYEGARTAKGMVDAVIDKIPNHVKRLKDDDYQAWLEASGGPKVILFTEKGTVSALLKALAVDFLGALDVAQIRSKEAQAVGVFGVEAFPTLVLLPGEGQDPVVYQGEMKREGMLAFLSRAASPNPEPVVGGAKKEKAGKEKKEKKAPESASTEKSRASKASSAFSKASASHESADAASAKASQTSETLEPSSAPTTSPGPKVDTAKPVSVPLPAVAPPLPSLPEGLSLQQKCLNTQASTCVLLLLPFLDSSGPSPDSIAALASLSEIHFKYEQAKRGLFPFYQVPGGNSQAAALRTKLGLTASSVEIVAVNGKRAWSRAYPSTSATFSRSAVEGWIDGIRMGDLPKTALPSGLIVPFADLPAEEVRVDYGDPETEKLREKMKSQIPEGMEMEMEEISDEDYERMMRGVPAAGKEGTKGHEEL
ncbi:hypothetical protein LTR53_015579 [Teratosphaeriaceae sp. CCFEE 6253]|nr:hypothetical protein LTR53_015579 [Teratosphaeriaceae sp. CCFEE 6253]